MDDQWEEIMRVKTYFDRSNPTFVSRPHLGKAMLNTLLVCVLRYNAWNDQKQIHIQEGCVYRQARRMTRLIGNVFPNTGAKTKMEATPGKISIS